MNPEKKRRLERKGWRVGTTEDLPGLTTREARLLQEALKLPPRERADLAAELLASLDEELVDDPQELEKAWANEIERRARRVSLRSQQGGDQE